MTKLTIGSVLPDDFDKHVEGIYFMGGIGSGNKGGEKAKQTTERLPFIDIRQLHKHGYLQPYSILGKKPSSNDYLTGF